MQFTETVMDHFENPRNVGALEDADAVAEVGSPECGDTTTLYLKIRENRIVDVRFRTLGCAAAIASSSMATELILGKSLEEAWALTNTDVVRALGGLPEQKVHCSVLAEGAIREAINDYRRRQGLEPWE
ncbi:iron-sulfur cluster assembly scaffold protein [Methanofollis fontis]|uniref:Iron-sulfur cluster assembly scaffold protein n=1 Tax=Methanofollis fontis TaxID=2052832 RepID=A0A483CT95_9EURY|nr:iron-sulfur cluster assembly scaffold protein [Methanofollis fontis]TAJ44468.1 iron-sulfur cluster assembly scaffold protein [Methanofollis fontis]